MLNKVMLIGNLGQDPETRLMPNGAKVTNISLATTRRWKDKTTGEKKESTEWHRVIFFNKLAEIVGEYCKKGSKVYVEGRLQTRKWTGQDGQDHYTTEILADTLHMLGSANGGNSSTAANPAANPPNPPPPKPNGDEDYDDDIPY